MFRHSISFGLSGLVSAIFNSIRAVFSSRRYDHGAMKPIARDILRAFQRTQKPICARTWFNKLGTESHYWSHGPTCAQPVAFWFSGPKVFILTGMATVIDGEPRNDPNWGENADGSLSGTISNWTRWARLDVMHGRFNAQPLSFLLEDEVFRAAYRKAMGKHPDADPVSFPKP